MRRVLVRVACLLGFAIGLCAVRCDTAHASSTDRPSVQSVPGSKSQQSAFRRSTAASSDGRRQALFAIDDGLPWGGYLKLGRFASAGSPESDDDWMSRRSAWVSARASAPVDRTFVAVEAGRERAGLRGLVSAAGQSQTGELDPRFTAHAYQRWGSVGLAKDVVASASAGTGRFGDRRFYTYTGSSRFSLGPLSFLAHAALVDTELARGFKRSWSAHAEAGWLLARRLDTKIAYEWLDPNDKRRGDERERIGIRVDPVVHQRVRAGVCYRKLTGSGNRSGSNADELAVELHVSF